MHTNHLRQTNITRWENTQPEHLRAIVTIGKRLSIALRRQRVCGLVSLVERFVDIETASQSAGSANKPPGKAAAGKIARPTAGLE